MNRFQFVADHQRRYGVKRLCTILGVARSSFYYWHDGTEHDSGEWGWSDGAPDALPRRAA